MPRVKKINFQEELSLIDAQIEKYEQKINLLKEEKKAILRRKEDAELTILYDYIRQTGKSVSEFIAEVNPS